MAGRVVVGIDGSEASAAVLRWAVTEARVRGTELDVVFAWSHPDVPRDQIPEQQDLEAAAQRTVDEMLAAEDLGDPAAPLVVSSVVAHGPAAKVLLEVAEGADLLVVGSRGMGNVKGMLLGSVSLHCVTHAHCPVAIIRTAGAP